MIDHLVMFADEASAFAALPQHTVTDPDTKAVSWNPSYAMAVSVTVPDGNGGRAPVPGYFAWIALPDVSSDILSLPNNACRLIADRDAANAGKPDFIRYRAPDLDDAVFNTAMISPGFAGANYPFGSQ